MVPVPEAEMFVVSRAIGAPAVMVLLAAVLAVLATVLRAVLPAVLLRNRRRRHRGRDDSHDEPDGDDHARARHAVRVDPVALDVDPTGSDGGRTGQLARALGGGTSTPRGALSSGHVRTSVTRRFGHSKVRGREAGGSVATGAGRRITEHPKVETTRG
jgi:hypothetical protein